MPPAGKLLLAAGIGRSLYGGWRIQKILPVLVVVAVLAVAAAVMLAALAVGGMISAYFCLLQKGWEPQSAMIATGMGALLLTTALFAALCQRLRRLKSLLSTPMRETVDAFLDGLLAD